MPVWELINPSDKYTIESDSFPAAAAVAILLGEGKIGLSPQSDGDPELPLFLFGGFDDFEAEHFGGDLSAWIDDHLIEIADAADSVLLGGFGRRSDFTAAMEAIDDPAKRERFRQQWQDKRSSLNDIGGYAYQMAAHLRERARGVQEAP